MRNLCFVICLRINAENMNKKGFFVKNKSKPKERNAYKMKKLFSIFAALLAVAAMSSTAAQNLLLATDEVKTEIGDSAYIVDIVENYQGKQFGSWSSIGKQVFSVDTETKKFGEQSLKISNPSIGHSAINLMLPKTLEPGKKYTFQAWVKTQKVLSPEWGASIAVEYYTLDDKGAQSVMQGDFGASERITGTKDWTKLSLTFTVPTQANEGGIIALQLWNSTGTAWFDGLAVVEGENAVDDSLLGGATESTPTKAATPTKAPTKAPTVTKTATPTETNPDTGESPTQMTWYIILAIISLAVIVWLVWYFASRANRDKY